MTPSVWWTHLPRMKMTWCHWLKSTAKRFDPNSGTRSSRCHFIPLWHLPHPVRTEVLQIRLSNLLLTLFFPGSTLLSKYKYLSFFSPIFMWISVNPHSFLFWLLVRTWEHILSCSVFPVLAISLILKTHIKSCNFLNRRNLVDSHWLQNNAWTPQHNTFILYDLTLISCYTSQYHLWSCQKKWLILTLLTCTSS